VVLGVLVIVGLVALVRAMGGDDGDGSDDGSDDGEDPAADIATDTSSSAPSGPTPSEASPAGASAATCWDGSDAQHVSECSPPEGEAGMAGVYPHPSQQRCGAPSGDGPGVVLRILCLDKLADGSRVRLGYYQWESVEDGIAFYDDQVLTRSDPDGYHQWAGSDSGSVKSATLYADAPMRRCADAPMRRCADAPFSVTVTLPASAVPVAEDGRIFDARPPEEVQGEPVD
jgi:hypothetical protein